MSKISEKNITQAVTTYLQRVHKNILYKVDLASDLKLSIGQACRHKKINGERGHPDLVIYLPKFGYAGFFIELKTNFEQVYKKNLEYKKNKHIDEQVEYMKKLTDSGYLCQFGLGLKDTVHKIDTYIYGNIDKNKRDKYNFLEL